MGKNLHYLSPQNHGHLQINTLPQQVPRRYRKVCGTQCPEGPLIDTVQAPKFSSKRTCTGCQQLGKQNSFSQPKVCPFLEQETQFEDLQVSLLNFVGLEWFTLQVFGLGHFTVFWSQYLHTNLL